MTADKSRVVMEISEQAIVHNYRVIKKSLGENTRIMPVIKADAYGHGSVEIAKILEREKVAYFAVAIIDEAIELRQEGIKTPILIFGYNAKEHVESIIEYNLTQTVFSYEMAKYISDKALAQGKKARVHINIDTGMGRIGFLPGKASLEDIEKISKLKGLDLEGIYTHFSSSDEKDKAYTNKQIKVFEDFIKKLREKSIHIPLVHMANSAAILSQQGVKCDMVRLGLALYGYYPSDYVKEGNLQIRPSMSIKSKVVHVKILPKNEPIGYNRMYTTNKETKVATIPLGYADGYSRKLSNKGRVLIKGRYAPVIGNICMDQFMVDVTSIKDVNVGEEVVIVGSQEDRTITVEEIAEKLETINYEVICMINKRIPRIYV